MRSNHRTGPIRKGPLLLLALFTCLWAVGGLTGEPGQVLAQAVRICLSCIGIG